MNIENLEKITAELQHARLIDQIKCTPLRGVIHCTECHGESSAVMSLNKDEEIGMHECAHCHAKAGVFCDHNVDDLMTKVVDAL